MFMFNLNEEPSRTPVWLPCSGYVHVSPGTKEANSKTCRHEPPQPSREQTNKGFLLRARLCLVNLVSHACLCLCRFRLRGHHDDACMLVLPRWANPVQTPDFRGQGAKKEIGKKNDQRRRRRNRRRWGHLAHLVTHLVHVQFERSAVQDPGVAPMFWIRPCPSRMTQEPEEPKRPTPRRAD